MLKRTVSSSRLVFSFFFHLQFSTMAAFFTLSILSMIGLTHHLSVLSLVHGSTGGFSFDLIHRDSLSSPLYSPLETHFDRLHNSFRRSFSRINRFKPVTSLSKRRVESPLVAAGGEYFMAISIGTPPVAVLALADTGSDLTWVQCKPCHPCYKQKFPIFDPRRSSTYKTLKCGSSLCDALVSSERNCNRSSNVCKYSYTYADLSFTKGVVSSDNFSMATAIGQAVSFPNIAFGCGHSNGGIFEEIGSGIVGLGGGPLSLVSQLDTSIGKKFSYCLVHPHLKPNATGKMYLGSSGAASGSNVVSSPLVHKKPETYYYVTLEAISVGDKRLPYKGSNSSKGKIAEKGNIVIDSGTTLTMIASEFYDNLAKVLVEATDAERVGDPKRIFRECFKADKEINIPDITVHLTGADLKLKSANAFVEVQKGVVCFAMVPTNDVAILGNLSQMDFLVGYDLEKRTVSFMPADCTHQH